MWKGLSSSFWVRLIFILWGVILLDFGLFYSLTAELCCLVKVRRPWKRSLLLWVRIDERFCQSIGTSREDLESISEVQWDSLLFLWISVIDKSLCQYYYYFNAISVELKERFLPTFVLNFILLYHLYQCFSLGIQFFKTWDDRREFMPFVLNK